MCLAYKRINSELTSATGGWMLGEQSACVHVSEEMASFTREGMAKEAKRGKYLALLSRSSTSSKSLLVFPAGGIPLPSRPSYKPAPS